MRIHILKLPLLDADGILCSRFISRKENFKKPIVGSQPREWKYMKGSDSNGSDRMIKEEGGDEWGSLGLYFLSDRVF